jgi:hypothetical protein
MEPQQFGGIYRYLGILKFLRRFRDTQELEGSWRPLWVWGDILARFARV